MCYCPICGGYHPPTHCPMQASFNPPPEAAATFRCMFGQPESHHAIGDAGSSHLSYVQPLNVGTKDIPGWHVTTEVPGLKQGDRIPIHDYLREMKL